MGNIASFVLGVFFGIFIFIVFVVIAFKSISDK